MRGSGTLEDLRRLGERWRADLDASDELYFEPHAKVLLPSDDQDAVDRLRWVIAENGAHVSRNARRRAAGTRSDS